MHTFFLGVSFGLVTAGVLALSTVGLTLQFSVSRVINFAHGDIMTAGAYAGLAIQGLTQNPVPQALGAAGVGALVAWMIYRFLLQPFQQRGVHRLTLLVLTLAGSLIIQNILLIIYSGTNRVYLMTSGQPLHLGPLLLTPQELVIIVGAILAMLVCHILLTFTNFGKSLRAVSDNRELANISGINATRITQLTWAFGGALTGVAGFSLGITVGSLSPTFGFSFLFIVLSAAVVGGLGRPYGAMLGAIVVGLATQVSGLYITSAYTPAIAFGVLILVLLLRPDGILGRAVVTA